MTAQDHINVGTIGLKFEQLRERQSSALALAKNIMAWVMSISTTSALIHKTTRLLWHVE